MPLLRTCGYRVYQSTIYLASFFMNFSEPKVIQGAGSIEKIPSILLEKKKKCVLVVTDQVLFDLGLLKPLISALETTKIQFAIYHDTVPNPTIDNVESGLKLFDEIKAEAIIAFGGGSSMDCAKMIGARAANRKKSVPQMKGLLKVSHKPPLLIAVPTTAGTGSEATVAAVIVNSKTHEKYAINDMKLIPKYAVLDPQLLIGLPGKVTSTTGIDALTHAVESYTNHFQTRKTRRKSRNAVRLIKENLLETYQNPTNLEARKNMQLAAYDAGVAFTRGYVGNIHAIAHTFGGFYNVPHGLANAIIMPYVLRFYGKKADKRLAQLADVIALTPINNSRKEKAEAFIAWIDQMNQKMNIPKQIDRVLKSSDLPLMIERAYKEANPLYPTPIALSREQFKMLFHQVATLSE
ncbi:MAG TPA: iron-containing alcohol dehydrogenase [Bacilli bacterium]|nr:iron-containing alcohol dehydrogenase [Bacilli bacterium]MDD3389642.1 iron-containing alcohol dehydrogenase [Bacilli bacterium]MDD4345024.1 iron-containing alcohol dehydrogenase [Bacilli bacterium]MDD4521095.1 iron-containing alcohol dehydrogenase [Bacilli bacterium]MDY0399985.1 iron-containing alcohol dehydrogenase [Bacilli bacterium]